MTNQLDYKIVSAKQIKIPRNPYDEEANLFNKATFTFRRGFNILVGCNGSGKSTVLRSVKYYLDSNKILHKRFDNLTDGGGHSMSKALFHNDLSSVARMYMSSEGECIHLNIGNLVSTLRRTLINSDDKSEFWLLLDAIDSGLSIDNIIDVKDGLQFASDKLYEEFGTNVYIVSTANTYELTCDCHCIDVRTGGTISFKDYEDYRKFILNSKEHKSKRYKKINELRYRNRLESENT